MDTYWKATRMDGTDFYSGTVDYAAALASGTRVRVRTPARVGYEVCTADVLHASLHPGETLIGGSWPCRLFKVTGRPVASDNQHKYGFRSLVVVEEVEGWRALGPQGREVAALIERARLLTPSEAASLDAALDAAWAAALDAAWDAAWDVAGAAALDAAWDAAWDVAGAAAWDVAGAAAWDAAWADARAAAWDAAWAAARAAALAAARATGGAAGGLVTRDLITTEHYDALTGPWRRTIGPIHPDDPELT